MPREVVYKPIEKYKKIYMGGALTPPKFMPTYYEWLLRRAELIIKQNSAINSTTTIYEIPAGKIFYLTNLTLSYNASALATGSSIFLSDTTNSKIFCMLMNGGGVLETGSISLNFPLPIKLIGKNQIRVTSGAGNIIASGSLVGYLIDFKDIPVF